jgi:predicted metal-binding membrane protein
VTVADRPRPHRAPVVTLTMLGLSAAAWVVTVLDAARLGNGPGPMGLGPAAFLLDWLAMIGAMMLPVVAAVVTTAGEPLGRWPDAVRFALGYLAPWAVVGAVAYPLSRGTQALAEHHARAATTVAVALFVGCAAFQLSAWKERALRSCTPAAVPGSGAIRAGGRYGVRCVGATWNAMALFLALGFMHVAGAVAVTVWLVAEGLTIERPAQRRAGCRLVALGLVALAAAVAVHPALAPGLHRAPINM